MTKNEQKAYDRILAQLNTRDKLWVIGWFREAQKFRETTNPIKESETIKINGESYFCRRQAFLSAYVDEINYCYVVYKLGKTNTKIPLSNGETFKFLNCKEIYNSYTTKKIEPKDMIYKALKTLGVLKKEDNEDEQIG